MNVLAEEDAFEFHVTNVSTCSVTRGKSESIWTFIKNINRWNNFSIVLLDLLVHVSKLANFQKTRLKYTIYFSFPSPIIQFQTSSNEITLKARLKPNVEFLAYFNFKGNPGTRIVSSRGENGKCFQRCTDVREPRRSVIELRHGLTGSGYNLRTVGKAVELRIYIRSKLECGIRRGMYRACW